MAGTARQRHMKEFMDKFYPGFSRNATKCVILESALEDLLALEPLAKAANLGEPRPTAEESEAQYAYEKARPAAWAKAKEAMLLCEIANQLHPFSTHALLDARRAKNRRFEDE